MASLHFIPILTMIVSALQIDNGLDSLEFSFSDMEYFDRTVDLSEVSEIEEGKESQITSGFRPTALQDRLFAAPLSWDIRLRGYTQAFVAASRHPSTYRGGAESATARLKIGSESWNFNAVFDKDAYEPRWDDLSRYALEYDSKSLSLIGGDFTLTSGFGVTFWNKSSYASYTNDIRSSMRLGFDLAPATNTSVNNALRGVSVLWKQNRLQLLALASLTRYDAIRDETGNVLRISDGGYHRSEGEEAKRGSLEEKLAGAGAFIEKEFGSLAISLGGLIWRGRFSPGLTQAPRPSDPYPLTGTQVGATGGTLGMKWRRFSAQAEVSRDHSTGTAGTLKTTVKLTPGMIVGLGVGDYSRTFNNPHARGFAGRSAHGTRWIGISVEQRISFNTLRNIIVSAVKIEDDFPGLGDLVAQTRSEVTLETSGSRESYSWQVRVSDRRDSRSEPDLQAAETYRARVLVERKALPGMTLGVWMELSRGVSELGERTNGWGAAAKATISPAALLSSRVPTNYNRIGLLPDIRFAIRYFDTAGITIYDGDISYPDRTAILPMCGRGVRLSSETAVVRSPRIALSCKVARTYRLNSGKGGDGELYLSFTLKS